jgi:hypothetical protein
MSVKPTMTVCVAVPALLLLSGLALAGFYGYREIPSLEITVAGGEVPPGFDAVLAEPGKFNLWLATPEGAEAPPPGIKLHVFSKRTGQELPLDSWFRSPRLSGRDAYVSMGRFETFAPNEAVEIKSVGAAGFYQVSLSPHHESALLRIILTLMGIIAITISAAITVFLILIHRRQRQLVEEPGRH